MLTFAAHPTAPSSPSPSLAQALGFNFLAGDDGDAPAQPAAPAAAAAPATYWPCGLLNTFVLKMAAAGHCVNTDMMLGHRPYAQQQLGTARASSDELLRTLAARLQVYFDAAVLEGCPVAAALDEAQPGRLLLV